MTPPPAVTPAPGSIRRCLARLAGALAVLVASLSAAGPTWADDLDATPSTLASVYASAQGGDVIHLAAGNYGSFAGGSKPAVVTLTPQPGATATISPNLGAGVSNLRFEGLTIAGAYTNGARNVAFVNSRFTGLVRVDTPANISNANILFDHDTFDGLSATATSYEGRLTVRGYDNGSPVGVKITNSHFGNGGCSDGVQIIGGAYGVEVGPGNEFSQIRQDACSNHVDSIQLYGSSHTQIVGNFFHDSDTVIMAPDGGDHELIADNVMLGAGYVSAVQLGSQDGTQFIHNTVENIQVQTGSKVGGQASRGVVVQDNVFAQGADINPSQGSGCSNCPIAHNLFATSGAASGTDAIVGTPVFVGGADPSTYAGYQLASNSPGRGDASDGNDLGARVAGSTPPPPDDSAPDTTISSGPTGTTNDSTPTFAFTASEADAAFECRVDTASWVDCASPWTTPALADGAHSVSIRATDEAGNTDGSPATRSFTVATAPPPDATAPDTTITAGPAGPTDDVTPMFAFTASEANSAFECRVDSAPWASCASPWTTAALTDGPHSVSVRATDVAGNTDASPATRAFTVATAPPPDTTAPDTTIMSGPTATTDDSTPTFAFTASEEGSAFECKLDAGAWAECTSPKDYSALSAGSHTFSVRATDAAGNVDASPATRTWTIQSAPPAEDHDPVAAYTYAPTAPAAGQAVSFDAASATCDDAPCSYTWEDDGPDGAGGKQWPLGDGATMTFTFQEAGAKYVRVAVTDADGDTDSTRKTITVASPPPPDTTPPDTTPPDTTPPDTTPPDTTSPDTTPPDTTPPDTTIESGPDPVTNDNTPTFAFTATEIGSTFSCQVDVGQAATCTSPWTTPALPDGQHSVAVGATDAAGSADASPATRSFRVDTRAPNTTIESGPPATSPSSSATLAFDADEPDVSFECRLDWSAWADCPSPKTYTGLAPGRHWASVRATDAAGNVEAWPAGAHWRTVAP
jgi:Big-like domain-containing protein